MKIHHTEKMQDQTFMKIQLLLDREEWGAAAREAAEAVAEATDPIKRAWYRGLLLFANSRLPDRQRVLAQGPVLAGSGAGSRY